MDLPLWLGEAEPPQPAAADPAGQSISESVGVVTAFQGVQEAWTEHVPAEQGSADDLFASAEPDLRLLQQQLATALVGTDSPAAQPVPAPAQPSPSAPGQADTADEATTPQQRAQAVNEALRQADTHSEALQDLPEWQQLQTIRGAWTNLWRVIRQRAGEHIDKLRADGRVGEFFRKVSLKVCEGIARLGQAGVERLRRDDERPASRSELPTAEALLQLSDAALTYSSPSGGNGNTPPAPPGDTAAPSLPQMRTLGEALSRPLPAAANRAAGPRVSTAAARGRSTTAKKTAPKKQAAPDEQAGHLRRGPEPQHGHKPNQR